MRTRRVMVAALRGVCEEPSMAKRQGVGRIYRQRSRHTKKALPTWWIRYCVHGEERRESSHSPDRTVARNLLRRRLLAATDERRPVAPQGDGVKVEDVLQALITDYRRRGRTSLPTVQSIVKVWKAEIGEFKADSITSS